MTESLSTRRQAGGLAALIVFLAIAYGVAAAGGAATASSVGTWYAGLAKPVFNPPNWVFGPVWTALYTAMAVAAWRVWRRRSRPGAPTALAWYGVQLALNLAWSVIFFGLRQPGAAMVEVLVLLGAIVGAMASFRRVDGAAALILAPYAVWVGFAAVLNIAIWRLN
jgi:benzodiazapine receptor